LTDVDFLSETAVTEMQTGKSLFQVAALDSEELAGDVIRIGRDQGRGSLGNALKQGLYRIRK
jgi:hypothetical protein